MKLHRFVLTLGSNSDPKKHLSLAQAGLRDRRAGAPHLLPCSRVCPISFGLSDALFTDQVAVGETSMEQETFAAHLKALECRTGRTPEQRKKHPEAIPVGHRPHHLGSGDPQATGHHTPLPHRGLRDLGEPLLPEE